MAKARPSLTDSVSSSLANASRLAIDAELSRLRAERDDFRARYKAALSQIDAERQRADTLAGLVGVRAKKLSTQRKNTAKHPATMLLLLSDWHVEELVRLETNGLNRFDLGIADRRIAELAERFAVILDHERRLADIRRVCLWVGGDLISGHIHDDTAELAQLAPLAATRWAGERVRGFIDAVAKQADEVIVATSCGNHGRTGDPRIGTEMDHSFEQNLYLTLQANEQLPNVRWQVSENYLNHIDLDGFRVRAHHGHAYKSFGGVGGITIPVNKRNAAWDASHGRADLTVFGHWHQMAWLRSHRYVSNGSVIGHSAYATRIGATYEAPCQAAVVIDHRRNEVTKAMPIYCDRDLKDIRKQK